MNKHTQDPTHENDREIMKGEGRGQSSGGDREIMKGKQGRGEKAAGDREIMESDRPQGTEGRAEA